MLILVIKDLCKSEKIILFLLHRHLLDRALIAKGLKELDRDYAYEPCRKTDEYIYRV